jgi:hypothetical protein
VSERVCPVLKDEIVEYSVNKYFRGVVDDEYCQSFHFGIGCSFWRDGRCTMK